MHVVLNDIALVQMLQKQRRGQQLMKGPSDIIETEMEQRKSTET